jgi:hypothetical protein
VANPWHSTVALVLLGAAACSRKPALPTGPEQDVVRELASHLAAGPGGAVELYDLELRQRADLFEEITRAGGDERVRILTAARPRLGEPAALETLRAEVRSELGRTDAAAALAKGDCAWGAPSSQDVDLYAAHDLPKPKPEMGPEIGMFLYQLSREIGYMTKGRVSCPGGASIWLQLAKRRGEGKPLRIVRILP